MVGLPSEIFSGEMEKLDGRPACRLIPSAVQEFPQWLEQHEVDIGFVQVLDPQEEGQQEVVSLFEEELCLMASPEHRLAWGGERLPVGSGPGEFFLYL